MPIIKNPMSSLAKEIIKKIIKKIFAQFFPFLNLIKTKIIKIERIIGIKFRRGEFGGTMVLFCKRLEISNSWEFIAKIWGILSKCRIKKPIPVTANNPVKRRPKPRFSEKKEGKMNINK